MAHTLLHAELSPHSARPGNSRRAPYASSTRAALEATPVAQSAPSSSKGRSENAGRGERSDCAFWLRAVQVGNGMGKTVRWKCRGNLHRRLYRTGTRSNWARALSTMPRGITETSTNPCAEVGTHGNHTGTKAHPSSTLATPAGVAVPDVTLDARSTENDSVSYPQ